MDLTFTTGGNQNWERPRDEYYDDGTNCDSAESSEIGANDETWLQTTVTGEGTNNPKYS